MRTRPTHADVKPVEPVVYTPAEFQRGLAQGNGGPLGRLARPKPLQGRRVAQLSQRIGRHLQVLREILEPLGAAGHLTSDAHLAAMAIEQGAELCSCDGNFARFPGLRWTHPLAAS